MLVLASCGGASPVTSTASTAAPASASTAAKPAASVSSAGAGTKKVRLISTPTSLGAWPYQVALAEGWFSRNGIDLEIVQGFDQIPALLGGSADVMSGGGYDIVQANSRGAGLIEVGAMNTHPVQFMLVKREITDAQQLVGKSLGMTSLVSGDAYVSRQFLQKAGVDPSKVTLKAAGGSQQRYAALEAGQIDGTPLDPISTTKALATGKYSVLATPDDFGEFPWNVLGTKQSWATANPDAVVGVIKTLYQSMAFLNDPKNDPETANALVSQKWNARDVQNVLQLARARNLRLFDAGAPKVADLQVSVPFLTEIGALKESVDVSKMVDTSYYAKPQQN